MTEPIRKTFVQEWGLLIGFGALVAVTFVGIRIWTEQQANEPVSAEYALYLTKVASNSKSSTAYMNEYYAKFSRKTVASKHFEPVCNAVTSLAEKDGFNAETVSEYMARGCRLFIKRDVR
jgi:predicted negative regulator of RcsB-dependent stress response